MNAEMNKLNLKISKYDICVGVFIAVVCMFVFSVKLALIYVLGLGVGLFNYLCSVKVMDKFFDKRKFMVVQITVLRIFIVALIVIPFANSISNVLAYVAGFISNQIVIIFCTISRKGSA